MSIQKEKRAIAGSLFPIAQSSVPRIQLDFTSQKLGPMQLAERHGYYSMEVTI
jgi:hypothetical protein